MKLGDYPVGSRLRMKHGVDYYEYIVLLKTDFLAQHPTLQEEYAVPMLELPTLSIVWDEAGRLNFIPVEE